MISSMLGRVANRQTVPIESANKSKIGTRFELHEKEAGNVESNHVWS